MAKNFKLTIEYDGTRYHGWQRQKNDRTIQGEIEKALLTMTGEKTTLTGSGRTDAGVHALGQIANFHCQTNLDSDVFLKGLNSLLQRDIVIRACCRVDEKFHARFDAKSKTYHYRILNRKIPTAVGRQYAWYIRSPLNLDAVRSALGYIIGTHDFSAFEGSGSPRSHSHRTIMAAKLIEQEDGYRIIKIKADGFLRFMVRNIVGTLVDVGLGKMEAADFQRILLSKDRDQAGATAPARGLFLMRVDY
jgi:tRNA pseudouridine38-40 synthase